MKKIYRIVPLAALLLSLASCTESDPLSYDVEKPSTVANQEEINAYSDLKTYVDRSANPNFKLGAGISLSDYTSKSLMYRLVNKNFDEITLGYEMKHGAIVQADGKLDLDNVNKLLKTAQEANVSVFGHTLCWHANQNAVYLNGLIAPVKIPGGTEPIEKGYALKMTSNRDATTAIWQRQTAIDVTGVENNTEYILKFAAKTSIAGTLGVDLQATSDYSGDSFGTVALTTQYKEYELKLTTTKVRNRLILNVGLLDGVVFVDNVSLQKKGSDNYIIPVIDFENGLGGFFGWDASTRVKSAQGEGFGGFGGATIVKTAEEKKTLIGGALDKWITGMVTNCAPHVKAWDVVNEPMDDGKPYELKTGIGKLKMAADEFYWQDYLGKDYAVEAFRLARKSGNSTDKLFINDYNLEYSTDKCKGLIEYVKYIESKGQKVDGIGTQMHITINSDKAKIETMFQLLAATGKLIKVSELDVAAGLKPTKQDLQLQSDMYKYVVDMYMKYIPANQRYGITVWGLTDSKADSSWLPGQNQGLWDLKFTRKTAYTGFVNGLKGSK
jgi:endo-1,4-beta-xylanase